MFRLGGWMVRIFMTFAFMYVGTLLVIAVHHGFVVR